jgi:hypothetical protein
MSGNALKNISKSYIFYLFTEYAIGVVSTAAPQVFFRCMPSTGVKPLAGASLTSMNYTISAINCNKNQYFWRFQRYISVRKRSLPPVFDHQWSYGEGWKRLS